jgi:hypothetical protein
MRTLARAADRPTLLRTLIRHEAICANRFSAPHSAKIPSPIPRKHLMHAILIAQLTRDHFVSLNRFRALLSAYPRLTREQKPIRPRPIQDLQLVDLVAKFGCGGRI